MQHTHYAKIFIFFVFVQLSFSTEASDNLINRYPIIWSAPKNRFKKPRFHPMRDSLVSKKDDHSIFNSKGQEVFKVRFGYLGDSVDAEEVIKYGLGCGDLDLSQKKNDFICHFQLGRNYSTCFRLFTGNYWSRFE